MHGTQVANYMNRSLQRTHKLFESLFFNISRYTLFQQPYSFLRNRSTKKSTLIIRIQINIIKNWKFLPGIQTLISLINSYLMK